MYDESRLRDLAAAVGEFYITDRSMKSAQKRIEAALEAGNPGEQDSADYVSAVRKYFRQFSKEAHAQLREVDKRLEQVNQVHFNLTAERGVVTRRIEATQNIIERLERVASSAQV